jgi:hypothetical protein
MEEISMEENCSPGKKMPAVKVWGFL